MRASGLSDVLYYVLALGFVVGVALGIALPQFVLPPRVVVVTSTVTTTLTETKTLKFTITSVVTPVNNTVIVYRTKTQTVTTTVTYRLTLTETKTVTRTAFVGEPDIQMDYLGVVVAGARYEYGGSSLTAVAYAHLNLKGITIKLKFYIEASKNNVTVCAFQEQGGLPLFQLPDKYRLTINFYQGDRRVATTQMRLSISDGQGCNTTSLSSPLPSNVDRLLIIVRKG